MNTSNVLQFIKWHNAIGTNEKESITIHNNRIEYIKNGKVMQSRELIFEDIDSIVKNLFYGENVFKSDDIKYSPIEADKKENSIYWKRRYEKIDFPKMMPILKMA